MRFTSSREQLSGLAFDLHKNSIFQITNQPNQKDSANNNGYNDYKSIFREKATIVFREVCREFFVHLPVRVETS